MEQGQPRDHVAALKGLRVLAEDNSQVKIAIDQRYALEDVQQAHRDLEARKTTGCTIFTL